MKATSALAMTAAFVLLTACSTTTPTDQTTTDTTDTTDITTTETVMGTPYVSEKLGFQISFPASWENLVVSDEKETTWGDAGTATTTYFQIKDVNDLFAVTRFTKEQWATVDAQEGPKPTLLEENDEFVWAYDQTQDGTGVLDYLNVLPEILKTFQTL